MSSRRIVIVAMVLSAGLCLAKFRSGRNFEPPADGSGHMVRIEGGLVVNEDEIHTARETASHSSGTPNWTNAPGFENDVFTFTRVIFQSNPAPRNGSGWGRGRFRWLGWWGDYPDAALDFSFRLQQVTALESDPYVRAPKLSAPHQSHSPLVHMDN